MVVLLFDKLKNHLDQELQGRAPPERIHFTEWFPKRTDILMKIKLKNMFLYITKACF